MTSPAEPAAATVPSFSAEMFWARNQKKIILGSILVVVAVIALSLFFAIQAYQNQKAQKAYARAKSIGDWQLVIKRFPHSVAAGNAYLRIAADQSASGKYADSDQTYQTFVKEHPAHPLVTNGYMGLAQNAESENRPEVALQDYTNLVLQFGNSYLAPLALFNQARLTEAKGNPKEARQLYGSVVQRYPESTIAGLARQEASRLQTSEETSPAPKLGAPAASANPTQKPQP